ncbi:protein ECT2 isoform X2 [Chelonus insularis]|uniref:protein ECT2 isoform X2 n=1 Tax=Chelonus insularis TaxID=460826 RepID=UPI001588ABF5|nr:protein ECT2 isoform X2 [Chelonus insularis]
MEEQSVHSSISDINSEEATKSEPIILPRKKRICLVGIASSDPILETAAYQFNVPVLKSDTGVEYVDDTTYCTYFVLKHFEGSEYEVLHKSPHRILGPTALVQLAERKESLPSINRPMYTRAMLGTVVVFTGFRKKDELTRLINMIHSMGGSIRKDMGAKVTHLIANCCGGDKYRYAVTFRVPIMSMNWVIALWDAKNDVTSYANNENMIAQYKLKPFFGAKVCFFGFPDDEKRHMCEVLQQQGGEPTEIDDPECTHVVTDFNNKRTKNGETKAPRIQSSNYSNTKSIPSPPKSSPLLNQTFILSPSDKESPRLILNNSNNNDDDDDDDDDDESSKSQFNSITSLMTLGSVMNIDRDTAGVSSFYRNTSQDSAIFMDYFSSNSEQPHSFNESDMLNERNNFLSSTKILQNINNLKNNYFKKPLSINDNNLFKKKHIIPRRYLKWKKSKSCFTLPSFTATANQSQSLKKQCSNTSLKQEENIDEYLCKEMNQKMKKHQSRLSISKYPYYYQSAPSFSSSSSSIHDMTFPLSFKQCSTQISPHTINDFKIKRRSLSCSFFSTQSKSTRLSLPNLPRYPKGLIRDISASVDFKSNLQKEKYFKIKQRKDAPSLMVVDESNVNTLPDLAAMRAFIVKAEWFWTSVQNEGAADEKEYLFEDYLESILSPSATVKKDNQQTATPTTASTRRKRKRLADTLSSLVQNGTDSPAVHKRRSSISDAGHLSVSGSFLDCTASPDKQMLDDIPEVEAVTAESTRKNLSPRHQVFLELVQTESNYVGILSTIMTLFKSPLEDYIETSNELLNSTEAKIIFGNFPPIYEVHKKMLEELRYSAAHWAEDISIGNIFLKYAPDLVKAYPPYVNFFENTKEMLDQCDQNKPRFHAFLKICQTKPECGRQSLKELMIKPVQRLPSISLLLTDILKHTSKNNSDHGALELSISSIKEVMTYINEDKRKTEGQLVMFDIFNEIDNCPPHLVSSHRSFIGKCDVMELGEGLSGRGDHLVLFLFTDTLEICKKRSKAFNSLKSPNMANGLHTVKLNQGKPYKHIKMLSLSTIKKVVDIRETDECQKVFALMVRNNQELKEKLYSFTITDEEINKSNYLRTLCRQMANTVCKADADTFLISLDSHQLEIDTSDVALGTLSKAFKFASRTRMKVGRAFSFNKTPSKLKRAMSTMMSPFGSTNSLTPASQQLAQMRLASCNNINELGNNGTDSPSREDVLVAPMSVQPTRKAKCSSLSMASLRRNCSEEMIQDKANI